MRRFSRQEQIGILLIGLLFVFSFARPLLANPLRLLLTLFGLVVAITVHEFGHAWVAYRLGDNTAKLQGRVSFNPVVHFDPVGAMMILFTFASGFGLGWGKPVPVNPRRLAGGRNGMAVVAMAGIAMNLLTAVVLAVVIRLLSSYTGSPQVALITQISGTVMVINVFLAMFNFIIALPPLDGYNFLVNVLPLQWALKLRVLEQYGPALLLLVIIGSQMGILGFDVIGKLVGVPATAILRLLGAL